jgi:hypothetical protein
MPRTARGWGTDGNAYICSKRRARGKIPTAIKKIKRQSIQYSMFLRGAYLCVKLVLVDPSAPADRAL